MKQRRCPSVLALIALLGLVLAPAPEARAWFTFSSLFQAAADGCFPIYHLNNNSQGWYGIRSDGSRDYNIHRPGVGYADGSGVPSGALKLDSGVIALGHDAPTTLGLSARLCLLARSGSGNQPGHVGGLWVSDGHNQSCAKGCFATPYPPRRACPDAVKEKGSALLDAVPDGKNNPMGTTLPFFLYQLPAGPSQGPECPIPIGARIDLPQTEELLYVDHIGVMLITDDCLSECAGDADCQDDDACTRDRCVEGQCQHLPIADCCTGHEDCEDGDSCTVDFCWSWWSQLNKHCYHWPSPTCCEEDDDCDDDDLCTADLCVNESCTHASACDDGFDCTTDLCDATSGACSVIPDDTLCDDGAPCETGVCLAYVGCTTTPSDCDDGDACTIDSCDAVSGCQHTAGLLCDDGNPCTDDGCITWPGSQNYGCDHTPNEDPCDDDNPCTGDESLPCDGTYAIVQGVGCGTTESAGCAQSPPTPETCDGVDNDCDGITDNLTIGSQFQLQQGGSQFQVSAVDGTQSVWDFYHYGDPMAASANTGYEVEDRGTLVLYRDISDPDNPVVSLVLLFDKAQTGSSPPAGGTVQMKITGIDSLQDIFTDDPGELISFDTSTGEAVFHWSWSECCTDGVVVEDIDSAGCISFDPISVNTEKITGIDLIDATGSAPTRQPLPNMEDTFTICGVGCCAKNTVTDSCDGYDSDCDGLTDEDFSGGKSSCGWGTCFAEGVLKCEQGAVTDTCVPSGSAPCLWGTATSPMADSDDVPILQDTLTGGPCSDQSDWELEWVQGDAYRIARPVGGEMSCISAGSPDGTGVAPVREAGCTPAGTWIDGGTGMTYQQHWRLAVHADGTYGLKHEPGVDITHCLTMDEAGQIISVTCGLGTDAGYMQAWALASDGPSCVYKDQCSGGTCGGVPIALTGDVCADAQEIPAVVGSWTDQRSAVCHTDVTLGDCVGSDAGDVIYRFTLTETMQVEAQLDAYFAAGLYLTQDCEDVGSDFCVDDSAPGDPEVLTEQLPAGTWYLVVDGSDAEAEGDFDLTVIFTRPPGAQMLSVTVTGAGDVNAIPGSIVCGSSNACSQLYAPHTVVTLHANPQPGGYFISWSGDCVGSDECVVTVDSARLVHALFSELPPPEITLEIVPPLWTSSSSAVFGFSTQVLDPTFECSVDGGAPVPCTSPWSLSGLSEGPHTFEVTVFQSDGQAATASYTWTIDTVPPDTYIDPVYVNVLDVPVSGGDDDTVADLSLFPTDSQGTPVVGDTSAEVHFWSQSAPVTYNCQIDGGVWFQCTSPLWLDNLEEGLHTVAAQAVDETGNPDPIPATISWIVDLTPPDTFILTGPSTPNPDPDAWFTFDSNEEATYVCTLDGSPPAPCDANWTLTNVTLGPHVLTVAAIDMRGLQDLSPAVHSWTQGDPNCGDGVYDMNLGEQCDDGNTVTEACAYGATSCIVCDAVCMAIDGATAFCGDTVTQEVYGEGCDDGNTVLDFCPYGEPECMVCDGSCQWAPGLVSMCGDGIIDGFAGETCDDGNTTTELCAPSIGPGPCTVCDATCHEISGVNHYCGDGEVYLPNGEQCDDGNTVTEGCGYMDLAPGQDPEMFACTVCNASCMYMDVLPRYCGDDHIDESNGESCDDGNTITETCPYGASDCQVCNADCLQVPGDTSFCGDETVDPGEECDDGNTTTEPCTYGSLGCTVCNDVCQWDDGVTTYCGDGIITASAEETCDDGNTSLGTCEYGVMTSCVLCDDDCQAVPGPTTYCGDNAVDSGAGETCDDGNAVTEVCTYGETVCMVCDASCHDVSGQTAYCGDGVVDEAHGETCDDPTATPGEGCDPNTGVCVACDAGCTLQTYEAPDTFILTGPNDPSSLPDASFIFSSNQPDVSYLCTLDGGDAFACNTPYDLPGVANGMHTLTVAAVSAQGGVDPTPATWTWLQTTTGCATDSLPYGGGDGSINDPYRICTFAHLDRVRDQLAANFIQMADIYLEGKTMDPIGGSVVFGVEGGGFEGHYDGGGHLIKYYQCVTPTEDLPVGLFRQLEAGSKVSNLTVQQVYVNSAAAVGALAGVAWSATIENVDITYGTVIGAYEAAGVVGVSMGSTFTNVTVAVQIQTDGNVGGVVAYADNDTTISYATVEVGTTIYSSGSTGDVSAAGGIAGLMYGGEILDSGAMAEVTWEPTSASAGEFDNYAGGVVGYAGDTRIARTWATHNVTGYEYVGGLVGSIEATEGDVRLEDCWASGNVLGQKSVGGLAGLLKARALRTFATGSVQGYSKVGGLVGSYTCTHDLHQAYATGDVQGETQTGGLLGFVDMWGTATVSDVYATGNIPYSSSKTGGLVGHQVLYSGLSCGAIKRGYVTTAVGTPNLSVSPVVGTAQSDIFESIYYLWNSESPVEDTPGTHPLSASAMEDPSSYVGFDFSGPWRMPLTHPAVLTPVLVWQCDTNGITCAADD